MSRQRTGGASRRVVFSAEEDLLHPATGGPGSPAPARRWQSIHVDVVRYVVYYLLFFFWLLLTARIVVELVRSFARSWRPVGGVAIALESVYTITDPPVRALRRVIKPVRVGGVGLDLSIMVLVLLVWILMEFVKRSL